LADTVGIESADIRPAEFHAEGSIFVATGLEWFGQLYEAVRPVDHSTGVDGRLVEDLGMVGFFGQSGEVRGEVGRWFRRRDVFARAVAVALWWPFRSIGLVSAGRNFADVAEETAGRLVGGEFAKHQIAVTVQVGDETLQQ